MTTDPWTNEYLKAKEARMSEYRPMDEESTDLHAALSAQVGAAVGQPDGVRVEALHTGGGVMVVAVDLSLDGRGIGRQVWLTREEDWIVGFYDFADEEDEGVCVRLYTGRSADDPAYVAGQVAGILQRLGVTVS